MWRPIVCSRLRLMSAQPAASWLLPETLRFVSISNAVQHIEVAFSSTGFAREIAAVSIFRNLRSLSIDFQREQATTAPPEGSTAQLKKLFAHLPALEHVTLIEPTLVLFDIASLFPSHTTQLRSLRLQIRQRTTGRITTVPQVKSLDLQLGGRKDDIPTRLPWQTLEALTVDSDAMESAALQELENQLTEAARKQPMSPQLPLKRLSVVSTAFDPHKRVHVPDPWFASGVLRAEFEQMPKLLPILPNLTRLILKSHDTRCTTAEALARVQLSRFQLARQHRNVSDLLALLKASDIREFRSWHSLRGDSHVRWIRSSRGDDFKSDVWYAMGTA
ncbi:hypothetical protein B0A53_02923 [Rhodotorula sp. CCFEE 5036]|nr:hypothetical protein B0A53_02923 [Rhodotorula sp. CCFEE 5036]